MKFNLKKTAKYSMLILLISLIIIIIINRKLVRYLAYQGYGQINIVIKSKPVEEVLLDPKFPDSLKIKLKLIQEIRQFAIKEIGLHNSKNYTTLYDQHGQQLVWLVKACPPFELNAYQWKFPIFGRFSYLGFFDKKDAVKLEEQLRNKGMDTRIGNVGGWSTLGFFKDPILSNMLYRSEGDLAELIIHELTHATVFVSDKLQFNENLASFVGEKGAELFLTSKYGNTSKEYTTYVNSLQDNNLLYDHILKGTIELENLYNSFSKNMADTTKRTLKAKKIHQIIATIDTISFKEKSNFSFFQSPKFKPNNTYFLGYMLYRNDLKELELDFKDVYKSNLKAYIEALKNKYK